MSNPTPRISAFAPILATLALAFVALTAFAGCAEDETGAACESYVTTLNALECLPDGAELAEDWCTTKAYDKYPCDVASHFQCLEAALSCDGDTMQDDGAACGVPICD